MEKSCILTLPVFGLHATPQERRQPSRQAPGLVFTYVWLKDEGRLRSLTTWRCCPLGGPLMGLGLLIVESSTAQHGHKAKKKSEQLSSNIQRRNIVSRNVTAHRELELALVRPFAVASNLVLFIQNPHRFRSHSMDCRPDL